MIGTRQLLLLKRNIKFYINKLISDYPDYTVLAILHITRTRQINNGR